jgi:hypothetical protein
MPQRPHHQKESGMMPVHHPAFFCPQDSGRITIDRLS